MESNTIDKETADRITRKLTQLETLIDSMSPVIETLGRILIRQKTAARLLGLHPTTLARNPEIQKYDEVGHRRTYIELADLATIKRRKPRRKLPKVKAKGE